VTTKARKNKGSSETFELRGKSGIMMKKNIDSAFITFTSHAWFTE
jgi:hypothetical protein